MARTSSTIELYLLKVKTGQPCKDCGNCFPYFVMQFDHARGDKLFELSKAGKYRPAGVGRSGRTLAEVKSEVEKCDVVCSNCHAIRTHGRKAK